MALSWTYKKPNKKGFYMMNDGDVETDDSMEPVKVDEHPIDGLYIVDMNGNPTMVKNLSDGFKFAYLNDELKGAITL